MGDAGLLVDPDDRDAFGAAIHRLLTEPDLRQELARRGPPQAAKFTWDDTARQTIAAYQEAMAPRRLGALSPRT